MTTKSTTKTEIPPPTEQELRLTDVSARIGEEQISAIQRQAFIQDLLSGLSPSLIKQVGGDLGLDMGGYIKPRATYGSEPTREMFRRTVTGSAGAVGGIQGDGNYVTKDGKKIAFDPLGSKLLGGKKKGGGDVTTSYIDDGAYQKAMGEYNRGVRLTEAGDYITSPGTGSQDSLGLGIGSADESLIYDLANTEYESGASDIDKAFSDQLRMLSQELAPSRGLRGSDAPILDRGGLFSQEALRQKSQLSKSTRAGASGRLLDLSERAKANRLQLLSGLSGLGIAPSGGGDALSNLTKARLGAAQSSTSGLNTQLIGSGISAGATLLAASSVEIKDMGDEVAATTVLEKLRSLPIYRWSYRGESVPHLGPTAEDFQVAFGVGDGKTLHLVDVMGVLLAAMKGLAEEASHG